MTGHPPSYAEAKQMMLLNFMPMTVSGLAKMECYSFSVSITLLLLVVVSVLLQTVSVILLLNQNGFVFVMIHAI
jgi:hypothetical protein